jgi:urease accessory protein
MEAAVADGRVTDLSTLEHFLNGRLATNGLCDAALAVAACCTFSDWPTLDAEAAARCPSPALRAASRAEGRGLVRAARSMWPDRELDFDAVPGEEGPMWSCALGTVARVAGLAAPLAAVAAAQASITGPAWACVRLLGLDPYQVAALLARLTTAVDHIARSAVDCVVGATTLRDLPSGSAPIQEIAAENRESWEVRLFVS